MQIVSKACWYNMEKNDGHIEQIYCLVFIFLFCCLFFKIEINVVLE